MAFTVQVAVDNATFHFDKLYSYKVPLELEALANLGNMVLVPFGKSSAPRMGVILGRNEETQKPLKTLFDIAPENAKLNVELLSIVHFLKEQTFCTYYEAVRAVLPYGAQYRACVLDNKAILQKQLRRHTQITYKALAYSGKLTQKQEQAMQLAKEETTKEILNNAGISDSVLKTLCKNGALSKGETNLVIPVYENNIPTKQEIQLSNSQQNIYVKLEKLLIESSAKAALLHGVTSSGKTLIFIKLIEKALLLGKQALVLVPEISLTPQMIYRLKGYFGHEVAVQHSGLSNTERLLEWQKIQSGQIKIVVGTRSAAFAPLSELGLIIIDEEQEHTYHSENSPRYDAREVLKKRAVLNNALLLLASATPSIQTYYSSSVDKLKLLKLNQRYNDMPLPKVRLIDMRQELANGNSGSISVELAQEICKNLADKKQTILLLNRRGYKTVGVCGACSEVLKCSSCSVPMVYHKSDNKILCHYCGAFSTPVPDICPKCNGKIRYTGFGTQRVEEELELLFPKARILRMDMDTTSRKNSHEKMLSQFSKAEYDIMIGTQMVAKGLDFDKVTLVGVLGVDQLLFAQGYKAFETVFSLITQVVGRGGRASDPGRALIQTVDPNHPVLNLAAKQDYDAFFEEEIMFRKLNLYPPFCAICLIGFSGANEDAVFAASKRFSQIMSATAHDKQKLPLRVLGPVPMNVLMVNNKYRYKLTVKCKNNKAFRLLMSDILREYNKEGLVSKASVYIDFNSDADI